MKSDTPATVRDILLRVDALSPPPPRQPSHPDCDRPRKPRVDRTLVGLADRSERPRGKPRLFMGFAAASLLVLVGGLVVVTQRVGLDGSANDPTPTPVPTTEPLTQPTLELLLEQDAIESMDAMIIGRDPADPTRVEIDRGSFDGVRIGMPVVNSTGLVGKVTEVTDTTGIVLPVTSPDFQIAAQMAHADGPDHVVAGIVSGQGFDRALSFSSPDQLRVGIVELGDAVVTAGGPSSLAPANILIGTVTGITSGSTVGGEVVAVTVEPGTPLDEDLDVRVILYQPTAELAPSGTLSTAVPPVPEPGGG